MAIALVTSVSLAPAGNTGGTSAASDTTGATLLVMGVGWYNGSGVANATVSDSKANTWIPLTRHTGPTNGEHRFFYALTPVVGTGHTFTIGGGAGYLSAIIYAFSGVASYQTESGNGHADTSPVASGSVTPSADGALVLTGLVANNAATDAVSPGGFTQTTVPNSGGVHVQTSAAYLIQATAAAINPTWSWSGGSHIWIGVSTAVFLATVGPAAGRVTQLVAETLTADAPAAVRVSQLVVEAVTPTSPPTSTLRLSQLAIETLTTAVTTVRLSQLVVEVLSESPGAITTTRTDRAVFPMRAVIGASALPTVSTLALDGLPTRDPGQEFLSVDSEGNVHKGPFDASELPPGSFVVAPESDARHARRATPRVTAPRGAVRGMYRYGWSLQTSAPPANATVRVDALPPYTNVKRLWADYDSSQSEDLYWGWLRVAIGSSIFIQDKDNHLQYLELETTAAPIDRGGYVEVPVGYVASGDALAVQECLVGIGAPAVDAPAGLTGTFVVTWFTGAGQPVGKLSLSFDRGICIGLEPRDPRALQLPVFPRDDEE